MASGIIDTVKRAALSAYESTAPMKLLFGEVTSANPVKIRINSDLTLTEEFLVVNGTISVGDSVPLIRAQGGQKYIVLGATTAVVDETKYITVVGGDEADSSGTGYQYPYKSGYRISTKFGVKGSWACGYHSGLDIVGTGSKQIFPINSGTVVGKNNKGSAYGNHVLIKHSDGYLSLYAHMSTVYVAVGQKVTKNTCIGIEGATGRAYGVHLHLEVHKGDYHYPASIDPETFLNKRK